MNPNYVLKVKEDLDKLLDTQFIFPIDITQWLSLLVIVPKKNKKIMNMCKLQKIEFTNQERSTIFGFNIRYSC
jgi:hypothetical protein